MTPLFAIDCQPPWLLADFSRRQRMASWSLNRPGMVLADRVAWLQVRNADLPPDVDPLALLEDRLARRGWADALGLMTACAIERYCHAATASGDLRVEVLATLGLSNGVSLDRAGRLQDPVMDPALLGTINILLAISEPLTDGAFLECLSLVSAARTAALLANSGKLIGTGTDCIVIAAPSDDETRRDPRHHFAGLHTALGQMMTEVTYDVVTRAKASWLAQWGPV